MPSKEQPCIVGNERRQKDNPCIVGNERRQKDNPCIVGNQTPRQNSPGRAREGRTPLAPRHPRGCRGVERPTPAPTGTKILKRAVPASSETNAVKRTAPCIVGNRNPHQNSPGRAREGVNPLAPRHPRGCRGAERPTPRIVGNERIQKNSPRIVGNQNSRQNSLGELERV